MTPSDEEIRAAIAQQAGAWFIANQAGALSAEDSAAFLAWLRASPIHVREYLGVARIARQLPAAVSDPQVPLETFLAQELTADDSVAPLDRSAPRRPPPVMGRVLALAWPIAASLLALAAGILWWAHDGQLLGIPKIYRTAHGEQLTQRLPDGSVLRLDTDSEAIVHYSARERVVDLERGQALFEVAHETERRFRVSAGDAGAIAVGTQFDVYRKAASVEITVIQGEIAVFTGAPSWLHTAEDVPAQVQRVTAGYQVRIDRAGVSAQPLPADVDQTLGWAEHKIVFEHRPLGEVAAEFNRYGSIPVEIEDADLRALPVSGMFDAGDTESFIAFLKTLPGARVERTPKQIRVLKATPTT
jgi:transmembrane sensor